MGSLAKLMREQERLHLKIKAISAEGRLGGMILAALPVILAIAISFLRPAHYAKVHESAGLMMTMGLAAFLLVLGVGLIRRIVNFKV